MWIVIWLICKGIIVPVFWWHVESGRRGCRYSQMWVSGVSFMPRPIHPREKCLWYSVGWVGPRVRVVVLEEIKNLSPPPGKRTPFLGISLFCLVTALTELLRLSCLLKPTSERVTTHCVISHMLIDLEFVDTIHKITFFLISFRCCDVSRVWILISENSINCAAGSVIDVWRQPGSWLHRTADGRKAVRRGGKVGSII